MTIPDALRTRDPDLLNLRKAGRAALVSFPVFAIPNHVFDQGSLAAYAFFASFVSLAFSDFGGPRRSRALAYAAIVVIGGFLVVIGSLLSGHLLGSAVVMFAVVFAVSFASVFGGYAPAFLPPIALAYSLAVLSPLSDVSIDTRFLGWTIGGAAAMIAAVVLWPVDQRLKLRKTLARASTGLAKILESLHDRDAAEAGFREATDALAEARQKASARRFDQPDRRRGRSACSISSRILRRRPISPGRSWTGIGCHAMTSRSLLHAHALFDRPVPY